MRKGALARYRNCQLLHLWPPASRTVTNTFLLFTNHSISGGTAASTDGDMQGKCYSSLQQRGLRHRSPVPGSHSPAPGPGQLLEEVQRADERKQPFVSFSFSAPGLLHCAPPSGSYCSQCPLREKRMWGARQNPIFKIPSWKMPLKRNILRFCNVFEEGLSQQRAVGTFTILSRKWASMETFPGISVQLSSSHVKSGISARVTHLSSWVMCSCYHQVRAPLSHTEFYLIYYRQ